MWVRLYTALPRNLYFAIADEAKKQGLPFAGYVPVSVTEDEAKVRAFIHRLFTELCRVSIDIQGKVLYLCHLAG